MWRHLQLGKVQPLALTLSHISFIFWTRPGRIIDGHHKCLALKKICGWNHCSFPCHFRTAARAGPGRIDEQRSQGWGSVVNGWFLHLSFSVGTHRSSWLWWGPADSGCSPEPNAHGGCQWSSWALVQKINKICDNVNTKGCTFSSCKSNIKQTTWNRVAISDFLICNAIYIYDALMSSPVVCMSWHFGHCMDKRGCELTKTCPCYQLLEPSSVENKPY